MTMTPEHAAFFADMFARLTDLARQTPQSQRHFQHVAVGITARFLIFPLTGCVAAIAPGCLYQGRKQGFIR